MKLSEYVELLLLITFYSLHLSKIPYNILIGVMLYALLPHLRWTPIIYLQLKKCYESSVGGHYGEQVWRAGKNVFLGGFEVCADWGSNPGPLGEQSGILGTRPWEC